MHDIWNPWHGCIKKSEGCENCYMYFLDRQRQKNGADIYKVQNSFDYPLQRDKSGQYKIRSGEMIRVCMTSDFFLEQADPWRPKAWEIIRQRPDVVFFLLTKRPERAAQHLPDDWGVGWENVFFNVTCENQRRAEERMPFLLSLPFKHKGVFAAPFIGPLSLKQWLSDPQIEQVVAGGENYDGARPLHYEWVKNLYDECTATDTRFCFMETGTVFVKDGRTYRLPSKRLQSVQAFKSGLQYEGKPLHFNLEKAEQTSLFVSPPYQKKYKPYCADCAGRMICNGCSFCRTCACTGK
ncbi:MAG: DUF5131 family protein [Alphaproteobacteria bacterium]|nr:DUF5131 family protein [Alphaproteobacteria bacterium]